MLTRDVDLFAFRGVNGRTGDESDNPSDGIMSFECDNLDRRDVVVKVPPSDQSTNDDIWARNLHCLRDWAISQGFEPRQPLTFQQLMMPVLVAPGDLVKIIHTRVSLVSELASRQGVAKHLMSSLNWLVHQCPTSPCGAVTERDHHHHLLHPLLSLHCLSPMSDQKVSHRPHPSSGPTYYPLRAREAARKVAAIMPTTVPFITPELSASWADGFERTDFAFSA